MVKFDVFVGNIEFSVTDELLVTIFSEVGRVLDIRMKQEAGRPAGYGFVEYGDGDSCRAAIALLDGRPVNGRPMKVSHSHSNGMALEDVNRVPLVQANAISQAVAQSFNHPTAALPILRDMRRFAEESPAEARQCLANHPNVALAILEMEITCGFLARPAAPHAAPQQAHGQQGRPPPQQQQQLQPDFGSPPPGMSAPPGMLRDHSTGGGSARAPAMMQPQPQPQRSFDLGGPPSLQQGGFGPGSGRGGPGHYHSGGQQQQLQQKQPAFDRYAPPPEQLSYDPYAPPPQQQQPQQLQQPFQPSPAAYQAPPQQQQPPPVVQSQQPMPQAQAAAPPVASRARPADPRDPRRRGR